jgi:hypothetical protein
LPDGLRVRVTERSPLAVVRMLDGKLVWVDDDAVKLSASSPTDRLPNFFIRGWDETGTEAAQAENRKRLQKYLELLRDWDAAGLSERISEVDLADFQNMRVHLAGDDSQVQVGFLGEKNITERLKKALADLDAKRDTPCGPFINIVLSYPNNNVVIGTEPGKPRCGDGSIVTNPGAIEPEHARASAGATEPDKASGRNKPAKEKDTSRAEKERRAKKEQDKKEEAKHKAKGDTRPRRVG